MSAVNRILGDAMTAYQREIHQEPIRAYVYAIVTKGRFPEAEPYLAKNPEWAYTYARDVIKGRFPEAEETIANSAYKEAYLNRFPGVKDDWIAMGYLGYLD